MLIAKLKTMTRAFSSLAVALMALYGIVALLGNTGSVLSAAGLAPGHDEAAEAAAAVPLRLDYQGTLRDTEGTPLTGYYSMTFRIYDSVAADMEAALWSEEHISVTVRSGRFSVLLGEYTPLPATLFNSPDRYVGVTVDPFSEMVPRQRFASVPYAVRADHVTGLNAPDGSPRDAVFVDNAGRVGVGTKNPDTRLHVTGPDSDGTTGVLKITSGSQNLVMDGNEIDGSHKIHLNYNNSGDVTLGRGGGSVAVGRANPAARLDVNGGALIRGDLDVDGHITSIGVTGRYEVRSENGANPSPREMTPTGNSFCGLTKVALWNAENEDEVTFCEVYASSGSWWLKANSADDANAHCEARCIRW
jgi:hypothetical protein